ncbi:MAG TPA: hypothetical protein PK858_05460, partial [Saprospiraceae bacterium]|nr:hypothetical protein [Saprospiraceae bacterium]
THIVGGGITYECLGDVPGTDLKRYRFTMKLYRDCQNGQVNFDKPAYISVYRGTYQNSLPIAPTDVTATSIQQVEIPRPDCITNLPNICLQEATYIWVRALPVSNKDSYFIAYQRCCRTAAIANVINPSNTGATYFVEITPAAQQVCNNSPVFNNFPPPVICNGYPLEVDYSVTDKDGDQLVYSLCLSYSGGGMIGFDCEAPQPKVPCPPPFNQLNYTQPTYSALNPMGGNPKVNIDAQTGFISGTPTHNGQYVVNVCVQEYREGTLLSVSRREFQFNVAPCEPQVSARIEHDSLAGLGRYVVRSCSGSKTLTLKNTSFPLPDIQNYRWYFDLKNGTVLDNGQDFDLTATFPDYGSYTGMLVLNTGLTCSDTAFIQVDIFPESSLDLGADQAKCPNEVLTLNAPPGGALHNFRWQDGSTAPSLLATQPGTYWLEAKDRCGNLLRDTVLLTARPDCPCPEGAFFKTLGTEAGREVGSVLCATRDSHLYLAGLKDERAFLAKLTLDGKVLWARDLSTDIGDAIFVTQIIEDSDGMVVGHIRYS